MRRIVGILWIVLGLATLGGCSSASNVRHEGERVFFCEPSERWGGRDSDFGTAAEVCHWETVSLDRATQGAVPTRI